MDETVDSFLKEINQIAPPKSVWEECYDDKSGFTYYWNTQTDDVTWDVPAGYKKSTIKSDAGKKKLYIPPPSEEKIMLGSIPHVNKDNVKIYKIDDIKKPAPMMPPRRNSKNKKGTKKKSYPRRPSDSDDEKIVLISSYGTDSSSEDEEKEMKHSIENKNTLQNSNYSPDKNSTVKDASFPEEKSLSAYNSEDETDILAQIQNKAKMLKQMGGDVPEGVKKLVSDTSEKKEVTGFSLVAGYGDDSEEDEESEKEEPPPPKLLFPIQNTKPLSSLFPITQSAEMSPSSSHSHEEDSTEKPATPPPTEQNVDMKPFQRKRRIGISLINVQKRPEPSLIEQPIKDPELARPGFGFKGGTPKQYPGFKSGGVMFTKSEETTPIVESENDFVKASDEKLLVDIEEFHSNLDEKLKFLCEGHNPALPVQIMIIQMETLYTAMKEKCLKPTYLQKWLNNTCQDLSKLEQEAAPAGWLLQWDRTHKRYFYQNQTSGENQWEYPQSDIVSVDEAMDISTTPPPPVISEESQPADSMNMILPPPPPQIRERSMSPPPPPIISDFQIKENLKHKEPCPPGVDETELEKTKECTESPRSKDMFASELSSFYSDIATIETTPAAIPDTQPINDAVAAKEHSEIESVPAKKKKKVKISQGLAMKKKGVSKLVEKWKNVQKTY
ncbi:formin-binding protein 4 [Holotrichia oblita]|uniref:Formin-binding protein 4 n=1 Tax=Holotrichia oblita TaxID=644536 RepID=A0ACB9SVQ4_HOLOL|nr:formin-binding protein 4 [Holotrichia oblita]